jgi:hypothetical protein
MLKCKLRARILQHKYDWPFGLPVLCVMMTVIAVWGTFRCTAMCTAGQLGGPGRARHGDAVTGNARGY